MSKSAVPKWEAQCVEKNDLQSSRGRCCVLPKAFAAAVSPLLPQVISR